MCKDEGKFAELLLMDLSKAFDSLPHDLMAVKLVAYAMFLEVVRLLMRGAESRDVCLVANKSMGDPPEGSTARIYPANLTYYLMTLCLL